MASLKHPAPVHLRPKVDLHTGIPQRLALSQSYLSGQAAADPQKQLAPEASALAKARQEVVDKLKDKSDLQAKADVNQADLVVALDTHDRAAKQYAMAAAEFSGDDASLLAALGVERVTQSPRKSRDQVDAPSSLTISAGAGLGEVEMRCSTVPHAGAYVFEYKLEPSQPADPWLGGILTKYVTTTVTGLSPNQEIRGRARAVGGTPGPWSAEVTGRAK